MNDKTSRRQIFAAVVPAGAIAATVAATAVPGKAAPSTTQSLTTAINNFVPGVGGFVGTLTTTGFNIVNGVLTATGTLAGTVLNAAGSAIGTVNQTVTAPAQVSGSCQILSLTLGPLNLNLLGVAVNLNQVVLNISAVPGAGNLLGDLLCAVANLLNSGGTVSNFLQQLTNLLNQVLGAL